MKAVYPGCFDPVTIGHIDIIERAARLCDGLTVLVSTSFEKPAFLSVEERIELLTLATKNMKGVTVDSWDGLTVNYLKKIGASTIVRGVRSTVDFHQEQTLANINLEIDPNVETLLLCSKPKFRDISSRTIKEMVHFGAPIDKFVNEQTAKLIQARIPSKAKNKIGAKI